MGRREGTRRLAIWCLRWAVLAALWLALADSRSLTEIVAAAVVGALGASFAGLISRPGRPRTVATSVRLASLGVKRLAHPLARLILDNRLLAQALWRRLVRREPVGGSFRAAHLPADPALRTAAGRVAMEAWGSLTPNRYVIGVDEENGAILVHELIRSEDPVAPLARR